MMNKYSHFKITVYNTTETKVFTLHTLEIDSSVILSSLILDKPSL